MKRDTAFDEQVRALRGKVTPKSSSKCKARCTPEEWAAKLDYLLGKQRHYLATNETLRLAKLTSTRRWQRANKHKIRDYEQSPRGKDVRRRSKRKHYAAHSHTPDFRIAETLRKRVRQAIVERHATARDVRAAPVRNLGCSVEELLGYIESQFVDGMSWDNYGSGIGKWSIDHIVSLSSVDLLNPDHRKAVCHWSNLRPMWSQQNSRKKGRSEFGVVLSVLQKEIS